MRTRFGPICPPSPRALRTRRPRAVSRFLLASTIRQHWTPFVRALQPRLARDREPRRFEIDRIRPGVDREGTRLDHALHLYVPERKVIGLQVEAHGLLLAGCKRHALEPLEFDQGPGDRRLIVTHI